MSTDVMTKNKERTGAGKAMAQNERVKGKIRMMVQSAMLAAVSVILMLFEIPLPFAPAFYEIDLSEVPVLIGCFTMGPAAGVLIEFLKIVLNFAINGTATAGVGEVANFLIGCALVLPAAWIYKRKRSRKSAVIGMVTGTLFMTVTGCFLNAFVLLPTYAKAFGMPIEGLIEMGTAINGRITNLNTFVMFAVAPFNLLKGAMVSVIVLFIYKKISPILKMR